MTPVDYTWGERFDASLLNQRVLCKGCGVHFYIKVIEKRKWLEMQFVPDEDALSEDLKEALKTVAVKEKAEIEKKPVADQILKYLAENGGLGSTGKMIQAIGCSRQGFNMNRDKLIEEGKIKQVAHGIYQLINSTYPE